MLKLKIFSIISSTHSLLIIVWNKDGTFNNFWKDSNGDKPENSPYLDLKYWSGRYKNFLKILLNFGQKIEVNIIIKIYK